MGWGVGRCGGGAARPLSIGRSTHAVSVGVVCAVVLASASAGKAQDAEAPAAAPVQETHPKKVEHKRHHPAPPQKAEAPVAPKAAQAGPVAAVPPKSIEAPAAPASNAFDAQLRKAGATACAPIVSQLAAASMGGVTNVGTASNWYAQAPDKRPVTLLLGQKYGPAGVPNGATTVIAAPQPDGKCDAYSVQVVPSPLPCAKVRETMTRTGRQVADLAGVALLQDAASETMLVPTAANTCVLVGLRGVYAK